jgi:hypothetical protein
LIIKEDWVRLNEQIGAQPFLLLIDEINSLCHPINLSLNQILFRYFIDPPNRYLVLSSHQPLIQEKISQVAMDM